MDPPPGHPSGKRRPVQLGLFGQLPASPEPGTPHVAPAILDAGLRALADKLPAALRLGTSSWNFPGWRGLVYAANAPKAHLSRAGLAAYAQHPLLRTVGVDRTYYAPIAAAEFAAYAAQVPASFRFLVKGLGELLNPQRPGSSGDNPRYLDASAFLRDCIEPACDGLGDRLGTLLLQFPPQTPAVVRDARGFAAMLHRFLGSLPTQVSYAVELRDAALLTADYREALRACGAQHAFTVHPRMPSLRQQLDLIPLDLLARDQPIVVRWMLHQGLAYEAAVERYQPFDRLVDPDPDSRSAIAALAQRALRLQREVMIVVNNKAEGSSPCSILELARAIVAAAPGAA